MYYTQAFLCLFSAHFGIPRIKLCAQQIHKYFECSLISTRKKAKLKQSCKTNNHGFKDNHDLVLGMTECVLLIKIEYSAFYT